MDYLFLIANTRSVMELLWLGCSGDILRKEIRSRGYSCGPRCPGVPVPSVLAEINGVALETKCSDFTKLKSADLGANKVIVGSDIVFGILCGPLVKLVEKAMKAGTEKIIIADPGRPTFYEFCDQSPKYLCSCKLAAVSRINTLVKWWKSNKWSKTIKYH